MRITLLLSASLLGCLIIFAASADASGGDSQPQQPVRSFKKLQLSDKFWAEGVAIADVNRDGHMDVISGPYWYEGPDFKKCHAIFPATHTFTRKRTDGTAEVPYRVTYKICQMQPIPRSRALMTGKRRTRLGALLDDQSISVFNPDPGIVAQALSTGAQ
jgi:hypothetical protein